MNETIEMNLPPVNAGGCNDYQELDSTSCSARPRLESAAPCWERGYNFGTGIECEIPNCEGELYISDNADGLIYDGDDYECEECGAGGAMYVYPDNDGRPQLVAQQYEQHTPPPNDPRYGRFGEAMWKYITNLGVDFCGEEISEDILPLAQSAGLCCRVEYAPEIHGEAIECERGVEIWWWGDSLDERLK